MLSRIQRFILFWLWRLVSEPANVRAYRRGLVGAALPGLWGAYRPVWDNVFLQVCWNEQMSDEERDYCRWRGLPEAVKPIVPWGSA